ncbi:DUF2170 family protein [Marinomonas mediterranea]|uniref:Cytoplasmic protein n=1 Tax=Marinomonas mediterranea (strain ATCC 700492 / JCM 21426 / NBRC 103028 / MMB-1) TaxID=717774 RepID=F2JZA8_MARM1|nr:YjfI family protein [Marinomonas mediterranea]ADZ93193.1 Protein of unknown function DUF2170 [Marinomonas mediterranea MMB-1]WCN15149.1 DUF2170 family protein [Marinomonas mediterranea]WCN19192.1 DUF2170 family protein [Marinomonas mediterranea MMB-1]
MNWTLESIHNTFIQAGFYQSHRVSASFEESTLTLIFNEFGDLPIIMAIGDGQILVEAALVERHEFEDPSEIDYRLLTTHKYLPLSTIGIQPIGGVDWYVIFGALSTNSKIEVIIEELQLLVRNTFHVIDTLEPLYRFNTLKP